MTSTEGVQGYDRVQVEAYLQTVREEQEQLRRQIVEAEARIERAHEIAAARRLLAAMVLDGCDDIGVVRRSGDAAVAWVAPSLERPSPPTAAEPSDGGVTWTPAVAS